jgi:hypothetical protein
MVIALTDRKLRVCPPYKTTEAANSAGFCPALGDPALRTSGTSSRYTWSMVLVVTGSSEVRVALTA